MHLPDHAAKRSHVGRGPQTGGFSEVLDFRLPDLTAEAIVQRHPDVFDEGIRATASARVKAAIGGSPLCSSQ